MSPRASLDVSASVLKAVTGWIGHHRRPLGPACRQRAHPGRAGSSLAASPLGTWNSSPRRRVSITIAYRYLQEALDVIAASVPGLGGVLARADNTGLIFLCPR